MNNNYIIISIVEILVVSITIYFLFNENKLVKFNGKDWNKVVYDVEYNKDITIIPDSDMLDKNVIEVVY